MSPTSARSLPLSCTATSTNHPLSPFGPASKTRATPGGLDPIKAQKPSPFSRNPTSLSYPWAEPHHGEHPLVLRWFPQPHTSREEGNSTPATPGPVWAGLGKFYPQIKHEPRAALTHVITFFVLLQEVSREASKNRGRFVSTGF